MDDCVTQQILDHKVMPTQLSPDKKKNNTKTIILQGLKDKQV